jgi:hypothetical protein
MKGDKDKDAQWLRRLIIIFLRVRNKLFLLPTSPEDSQGIGFLKKT